jgi:phosphoglycolate phosphatase
MPSKELLVVLDFDGLLVNSYALLKDTLQEFGIDVGDEDRFKKRRKFLKYFGGGKELLTNLVNFALPKKKRIREMLTDVYCHSGRIYTELQPLINQLIASPSVHCGILSRNYTLSPGPTIRTVLRKSGVQEEDLDFVIPIPVGVKKDDVLLALRSTRYRQCILGGDEIGDYRAALSANFDAIIASYGFDNTKRLVKRGDVPLACIVDTPAEFAEAMRLHTATCMPVHKERLIVEPYGVQPSPIAGPSVTPAVI